MESENMRWKHRIKFLTSRCDSESKWSEVCRFRIFFISTLKKRLGLKPCGFMLSRQQSVHVINALLSRIYVDGLRCVGLRKKYIRQEIVFYFKIGIQLRIIDL